MERDIGKSISLLCSSLSDVLTHADTSSRALSDAVLRRPIPLEAATNAFLQGLDRRVEAAGADLVRLESMAFGTVSVEELLGHCREALNIVSRHADAVESRLVSYGYVPPEAGVEDRDVGELELPDNGYLGESTSVLRSGRERFDDDALFEDSMSLKKLGFSDACLATISSQDNDFSESPKKLYKKHESADADQETVEEAEELTPPQKQTDREDGNTILGMIRASKDQYEQLPPYMKSLASWEELQEAVSKLNSYFSGNKAQENVALNQDDVGTIGLGRKGRSYLLILLRLNQLAMVTIDGSILYTLRKNDS